MGYVDLWIEDLVAARCFEQAELNDALSLCVGQIVEDIGHGRND
ncbi:MAG: hypothetical protein ACHP93_03770 [Solirubrobacterales bacterium]